MTPLAAAAIALSQWPLSAIAKAVWTTADRAAALLLLAGIGAWIYTAARRPSSAVSAPAGSVLLTVGSYLAYRESPLLTFLVVAAGFWIITTVALVSVRSPRARASVTASAVLVVAILVEWFAGVLPALRQQPDAPNVGIASVSFSGRVEAPDPDAERQLLPLGHAHHTKIRFDGKLDFDVEYHTDRFASRVVPGRPKIGPEWYLFGCSFTFGEGVNDDQTIAANLQHLQPNARVFNFGLRDAGTSDAWIHLRRRLDAGETPQWNIYFFIFDHFRRAGLPDLTAATQGSRPHVVTTSGEPTLVGRVDLSPRSAMHRLRLNLLSRSAIYRMISPPWTPTEETVKLIADLGRSMDTAARIHVPGGRFLFVFLPTRTTRWTEQIAQLKDRLRQQGTPVLEVDRLMTEYQQQGGVSDADLYLTDGHPRAAYTALAAKWVSDFIDHTHGSEVGDGAGR